MNNASINDRSLRVLHVIPGVAPRYGGPSTAIGPMCRALARRPGLSVELATTDADGPGGALPPAKLPTGFVTHLFPRTFSEKWKYSGELWRWLRQRAGDYDILHVHALWSFSSAAAGSAARMAGVPYIVRPAGMLSRYTWDHGGWKNLVYWRLIERRTVFGAAAIHATSTEEATDVRAVRPDITPHVIPNGVEEAAWQVPPDPDALRRRCGPAANGQPIFLFLSRLHPKKGVLDLLLPAFARLPSDAFLAIAGGTDPHYPGYEPELRSAIEKLRLTERVAMLGEIAPAERWNLFDGAAAFVLPSHSENFGIVVAEAMARGCPVVVTEAVNAAEHVTAAEAGWAVKLTPDALADALTACLADPAAATAAGSRGRAYSQAHFDWNAVAGRIERMYRECIR